MTTLYIAGPMSGYPDYNRAAFDKAARQLADVGYQVVDPAPYEQDGWTWSDYLKRDLPLMLGCDGVATLPDWQCSRGGSLEVDVAQAVEILVMPVNQWLERVA